MAGISKILNEIEERYTKPVFLGVVSLYTVRRIFEATIFSEFGWSEWLLSGSLYLIFAVCLIKIAIDLLTGNMDKRAVGIMAAGFVVLAILYTISGHKSGIFYWVLICASHNVDYDEIIKVAAISMLAMIAVTFAACLTGILENRYAIQDNGARIRYGMGFLVYNTASHYTFFMIVACLYWRKEKITWVELAIYTVLAVVVFIFTNTKNPFFLGMLAIILATIFKLSEKMQAYHKIYGIIATLIHPVCASGTILLATLYVKNSEIWNRLNHLLTGRLGLGSSAINKYGISLFGRKIEWIEGGPGYNIVDSAYLHLLIENGMVFLAIIILMFVVMGIKSAKKKDTYFMLTMIAVALHCMFDFFLFGTTCDVFLFFMSYLFADTYGKKEITNQ